MLCHETAVAALLVSEGTIQTRLRERSTGDTHDLLWLPAASSGISAQPGDLVAALETLERRGAVHRFETVHRHDSTEYLVTWHLVGGS